jgi:hypothetical protein
MPDFNVRSDSVNVEQIMEQIRSRIREKRGVDYTEQQIRELAGVKLEKLIDPSGLRSDLLEQFKRREPLIFEPVKLPSFVFEDTTIYETHRGLLRLVRRLLHPILKLLFNPNPIIQTFHIQAEINRLIVERENLIERQRLERREVDALYYEIIHNLVVELTRVGIEMKNVKMRVESISSRLDFNERRARALENVVVYKPSTADDEPARSPQPPAEPPREATTTTVARESSPSAPREGPGQQSRRRRRRRGRRSGAAASTVMGGAAAAAQPDPAAANAAAREAPDAREETTDSTERSRAVQSHSHEAVDDTPIGPRGQGPDQQ